MIAEYVPGRETEQTVLPKESIWSLELPGSPETVYGFTDAGPSSKKLLAFLLLASFGGRRLMTPGSADYASISFEKDVLGRPNFRVQDRKGPPTSFSRAGHRLWGAMGAGCGIGIDAASPLEFDQPYPHDRVFHSREVTRISRFCYGLPDTFALLWSIKEATVKALGCGFHMLNPLDVEVHDPLPWKEGLLFTGHAGSGMLVWSRFVHSSWLSVAVIG